MVNIGVRLGRAYPP